MPKIIMTQGDLHEDYEVLDTVWALGEDRGFFYATTDKAFFDAKANLRKICESLGGDAIIFCKFESGVYNEGKLAQVTAFGTIVKRKMQQNNY